MVKLPDADKIPYERVGTHRRVLLVEVLAPREQRRREQYAALDAMGTGLKKDEDVDTVLAQLREARHAVARRREASPS